MTSLEKDTLSRNRIVSGINENFFVEAGAGSGKTTMLVNRMAAMVEAGLDISKICAITFTKAAAGEFYDRFQRLLIERSNPAFTGEDTDRPGMLPAPTEETRERCRKALQNIDLCFMGTIDSFCGMVLSEHPSEAGIPSDASIVSDEDAAGSYLDINVSFLGLDALHNTDNSVICLDGHIACLGQHMTSISGFHITYDDIPVLVGNRNVFFCGDVLSYQNLASTGLQAYRSVRRSDGLSYRDISLVYGNIHVIRNGYIPVKVYATLFRDIGINAFLRLNIVRNMNIAVTAVQGDSSARIDLAVSFNNKVTCI